MESHPLRNWPDPLILGLLTIVLSRARCEELMREMEEKGPPVDVRLLPSLYPLQFQHIAILMQASLGPPLDARRNWRLLEPRYVN